MCRYHLSIGTNYGDCMVDEKQLKLLEDRARALLLDLAWGAAKQTNHNYSGTFIGVFETESLGRYLEAAKTTPQQKRDDVLPLAINLELQQYNNGGSLLDPKKLVHQLYEDSLNGPQGSRIHDGLNCFNEEGERVLVAAIVALPGTITYSNTKHGGRLYFAEQLSKHLNVLFTGVIETNGGDYEVVMYKKGERILSYRPLTFQPYIGKEALQSRLPVSS